MVTYKLTISDQTQNTEYNHKTDAVLLHPKVYYITEMHIYVNPYYDVMFAHISFTSRYFWGAMEPWNCLLTAAN